MNAHVPAVTLKSLSNLNDLMALLERAQNRRELLLQRANQCPVPAIAQSDPQQASGITCTVRQMEEVFVFAHQNHRALNRVVSKFSVTCFVQTKVEYVDGMFSTFNQKAS